MHLILRKLNELCFTIMLEREYIDENVLNIETS